MTSQPFTVYLKITVLMIILKNLSIFLVSVTCYGSQLGKDYRQPHSRQKTHSLYVFNICNVDLSLLHANFLRPYSLIPKWEIYPSNKIQDMECSASIHLKKVFCVMLKEIKISCTSYSFYEILCHTKLHYKLVGSTNTKAIQIMFFF